MSKNWTNHSEEEKQAILERVTEIYEQHEYPSWLKGPEIDTQIVNCLNKGTQEVSSSIKIEGSCSKDQKGLATAISKDLKDALTTCGNVVIDIGPSYGVGSQMGVIENANKVYIGGNAEEGSTSIEHKEGQVILLDFWATWCPPCQAPMAHNQQMLEKRKDWGENVRLIGMSIDQDRAKLKSHIEDKKWTSVEHYHVRTEGCTADKDYKVQGVPHVLLVDTHGKIVFVGHPANRKLEDDIDKLLKGEVITGAGCKADEEQGAEDSEKPEKPENFQEAIDKFTENSKVFCKDISTKCQALPRAYLVLVDEASFNVKDKKWTHKATLITQLMGPEEDIQLIKKECAPFKEGPWEAQDQCRSL